MTLSIYVQALLKSFPLGIIVMSIIFYGLFEAIENKWERRNKID